MPPLPQQRRLTPAELRDHAQRITFAAHFVEDNEGYWENLEWSFEQAWGSVEIFSN